MIVVDTNVVSELVRREPSSAVEAWFSVHGSQCAVTAVSVGELWRGVGLLPSGKRRDSLSRLIEDVLMNWAVPLAYDAQTAKVYGAMCELAKNQGRGLSVEDGMIAASCAVHGASLATRNVKDFNFLHIPIINPWVWVV